MRGRILWAIVGGFLAGVFVRSFFPISYIDAAFILGLGFLIGGYAFMDRRNQKACIVIAIAFIAFSGGIARMEAASQKGDPQLTRHVGRNIVIDGMVAAEPDVRDTSVRLTIAVRDLREGSTTIPITARVLAVAPAHTDVSYGDEVRASGKLELPQAFDSGEGRAFDYPMYLAKDGILYMLTFAQVSISGERGGNPLQRAAIDIKHAYLRGLDQVLPEPEAGLAGGITVGDKRSIGSKLSAEFQKVSLIHMVVLSGYNITVVINAIARVLAFAPQYMRFGVSGLVVLFFVLMAGGAASAARAGLMALIAMYARISHRTFVAERALGTVAFLMILWNPYTLAFDPSFQLSALATLGLILFTPHVEHYLARVPERFGLREILSSTIATQLMVLPFLLYQNGSLSIFALPANLFALVPVPFAMLASFISAILGMIFGTHAALFGIIAYIPLAYVIRVATFFSSLPLSSVSVPAFSAWWVLAAYALLFGAHYYLDRRHRTSEAPLCGASRESR